MPNARPQCCCQAPQPRSGAPKAQGLIAARWPQHNRPCRRSLPADAPTANNISTGANGSVALQLQSRISTSLTDVTIIDGTQLTINAGVVRAGRLDGQQEADNSLSGLTVIGGLLPAGTGAAEVSVRALPLGSSIRVTDCVLEKGQRGILL